MSNALGLVELLLVLLGLMLWGTYELWTLRRGRKQIDTASKRKQDSSP